MRVLEVVREMDQRHGGPPRVVVGHALQLKAHGIDVEVACLAPRGEANRVRDAWPELRSAGIALNIFDYTPPQLIGRSLDLQAFVEQRIHDFDVMHAHGVWEQSLAASARALRSAGKPYVISPHGMLDHWSRRRSAWKKWLARNFLGTRAFLRGADAIVYGTPDEAREAEDLRLPGRQYIIPNGIEPARFQRQNDDDCGRLSARFPAIAAWETVVLFYGRLHPKKGFDLLIEAFARLHLDYPGAGIFAAAIAHDDDYTAALRRKIADYGLQSHVVLTTEIVGGDSRVVFDMADIFVLPSHQEGFSMAIIEAMACGIPVLITDACHMNDVVEWRAGKVVPVSVDGIEAGLRELLGMDKAALAEMGLRGREVAHGTFNWSRIGSQLADMFSDVTFKREVSFGAGLRK
jgi:glycosyltransferase involved in cell wall biosynthesis